MNQRSRFKGHLHSKPCAQGKCGLYSPGLCPASWARFGYMYIHCISILSNASMLRVMSSRAYSSVASVSASRLAQKRSKRDARIMRGPAFLRLALCSRSCRHGRTTCFRQIRCVEASSTYLTYSRNHSQSLPRTLQSPCFILLQMKAGAPVSYLPVLSS